MHQGRSQLMADVSGCYSNNNNNEIPIKNYWFVVTDDLKPQQFFSVLVWIRPPWSSGVFGLINPLQENAEICHNDLLTGFIGQLVGGTFCFYCHNLNTTAERHRFRIKVVPSKVIFKQTITADLLCLVDFGHVYTRSPRHSSPRCVCVSTSSLTMTVWAE